MRLQPGDVFFTSGGGLIAAIIRFATSSPVAHTGVVVDRVGDMIETHEAFWPGGLQVFHRDPKKMKIQRVYRPWSNELDRLSMIAKSNGMVGTPYDLFEIFRICVWGLNKFMLNPGVLFTAMAVSLLVNSPYMVEASYIAVLFFTFLLKRILSKDNVKRVICSNHIATLVKSIDPSLDLTYPSTMIWPGRLEQDLHLHEWRL